MTKRQDSAITWRRKRAAESFGAASEAIGPIDPGLSVFCVTRGQFSMIDCIHHVVNELGPCNLSVWTWAIADYEVQAVGGLMERGDVLGAGLIVDFSAGRRNADLLDAWRDRFGLESVRVVKNHAKLARVWTSERRVLLRGSFNLNYNPRFEQLDVTEGGPDFDLVERIEAAIPILPREHSHAEAAAASQLGAAFDATTLDMFSGLKVWQP